MQHSVAANKAPITAKFFPYDIVFPFMSLKTSLAVCCFCFTPAMFGSTLAENNPMTPPRPKPIMRNKVNTSGIGNCFWNNGILNKLQSSIQD